MYLDGSIIQSQVQSPSPRCVQFPPPPPLLDLPLALIAESLTVTV